MHIRGIDFSSVPTRSHPIVIAECRVQRERVVVDRLVDVPELARFESELAAPGPWLAAIDFPFGLPRQFLSDFGQTASWASYVAWAHRLGRKGFEECLHKYKKARASGHKEPSRHTDRLAKSQSPLKLYGVPVAKMFLEGAPRLLRAPVSIPLLRPTESDRIVIEAYPALVVRHIGVGPYKGVNRGAEAAARRLARERIVSQIEQGLGPPFDVRVELSDTVRLRAIDDRRGDVLDSILCAVQAAYALRRRSENYGIPKEADPLEGWIIGSELLSPDSSPQSRAKGPLSLVIRAAAFAARKHRDQRRKDTAASPYINHPIALANILCAECGIDDPVTLAAALLHDTIEDTETTEDELRGEFGPEVAAIVMEVTDVKWLGKYTRKRLQISRAARASHRAKLVKIADKIANLRDLLSSPPAGWSVERRREYFDWAKSVVDEVRPTHPELERRFDELYKRRPK